jgi:enoyl-CoA hydratase
LLLARDIASNAPLAVREALALARVAGEQTEEQLWRLTAEASKRIAESADAQEGTLAFLERRKPQWSGR